MQTSLKSIAISIAAAALVLAPAAAKAANPHNPMQGVTVGGTSADGNVFKGTMDVLGFVNDGGVVKAIANLNGRDGRRSGRQSAHHRGDGRKL